MTNRVPTPNEWGVMLPVRPRPYEGSLGWDLVDHALHVWWGGATDNRHYLCLNYPVVDGLEEWTS